MADGPAAVVTMRAMRVEENAILVAGEPPGGIGHLPGLRDPERPCSSPLSPAPRRRVLDLPGRSHTARLLATVRRCRCSNRPGARVAARVPFIETHGATLPVRVHRSAATSAYPGHIGRALTPVLRRQRHPGASGADPPPGGTGPTADGSPLPDRSDGPSLGATGSSAGGLTSPQVQPALASPRTAGRPAARTSANATGRSAPSARPVAGGPGTRRLAPTAAAEARLATCPGDRPVGRKAPDSQPAAQSPAAGLSSTVRDLARWLRLQLGNGTLDGKQIIALAELVATHPPQLISSVPPGPNTGRSGFSGLGWTVSYGDYGRVRLGHSGAFALGAGTNVALSPAEQIGILALTNGTPIHVAESLNATLIDLALDGAVSRDWLALHRPARTAWPSSTYATLDLANPGPRRGLTVTGAGR